MKKFTLFLVAIFAMINVANAQRAWAYDLELTPSVDSYTFAFKAVTAGDATLVFYKEGVEAGTLNLGSVSAGANTVTKTSEELLAAIQQSGDFTWGVTMTGSAIASFVELTKDSNTDFHFWMPTGVAVDNNPESPYFSRFYIASPRSGKMTEGGGSGIQHNAGVYVFDQTLTLLNETKQTGYIPDNVTVSGSDHLQLHRIAVNPISNQVAFSQKTNSLAAVWSMNPTNMKSAAQNLISGTSITDANSCCFDKDGVLYVANASKNCIYKVKDGVATTFSTTSELVQNRNAIASDGRGGLWIAQYRGQDITADDAARLMHINAAGTLDYKVDKDTPHGFTGTAQRGAVAYNTKEDILAFGANRYGNLYKVTYDAETGIPNLESIGKTPSIAANIDGLAFDYAGDLYVTTASIERLFKYAVPTNNNTCTTPAPKAQTINLVAATPEHTVTINKIGEGTVTGANTGTYLQGSELTLTATPAEHYEFTGWIGDVTSNENPLTINVDGNKTITANFAKKQYTLTVFVNDENKGTIDVATGSHEYGTEVTLTATPKTGYKLLAWSNKATTPSITLTMDNNKAVSAYFVKEYATDPTFTIEKVWENTINIPGTGNGYQAVGWDGKIYMQDAGNKKIKVFSNGTDGAAEYASSGVGQQIAVDEAGNLIVFNAAFYAANPNAILIYEEGTTTGKEVSFTLPQPGRCDFFTASGDIYSAAGGYIYFYCNGTTVVNRLKITNGAATAADVTTDVICANLPGAGSQSNVIVDIFGNIHVESKNKTAGVYNITNLAVTNDTHLGSASKSTPTSTIGGCTFELGGKEWWAYLAGTTNYSSEWQLYNETDGSCLSNELYLTATKTTVGATANWLNAQVIDEKTALIYQFCPKVGAAVWKVTMKENYLVSATATNGTVSGTGTYQEGATATLTATPNTGYKFVNWTNGGVEVSTEATYSFPVTENVELVANFEALAQYNINAHADHTSKGYVTGTGDYYEGEEVVLKATAKTGYYFTQWNDGNPDNPRTITVTDNAEYIAEFAQAYPRVYAYGLNVVNNGDDTYTFSFKPNTDAISGNLLLYSEDGTTVAKTVAITTPIVANTVNSITLSKTDLPDQSDIPWAIELSGNAIPAFAETFADSDLRFARAHAVVDNSPESEYFGRVYVADRRSTKSNSKVYVYNPDFTDLTTTNLGLATAGYSRPAVGADGTLYLTGYTDGAEAGIFVVDPADLTKCTQFFNGTYDSDGLYTNNGKEIGSSTSGVGVYGAGKDAVLYTMMEDGSNANFISGIQPIVKYQIGQENGTVLKQWSDEPTWLVNYPATGKDSYNFGNNDFAATAKGVWVSQNKSNPDDRPEIAFVDKTGTIQFMQNSKPSLGGGMTVNADNTVLYIVEDGKILEYAITWSENTPSLTLSNTYPISLQYISTLSVDYAGNLIACAGTTYGTTDNNVMKVVRFTLPTDNNTTIVPAPAAKALKLGTRYTVTVVINDESMGEVIGAGSYKEGETVELAAAPVANHRIIDWKKGEEVLSTSLTCSFEVTEDVTINVTFEKIPQYTVTTVASPAGKGSITGGGLYNEGTNVTLTATAHTGYTFVRWEDDDTAEATRTITVTGDITYTAIFDKVAPRAWAYDLRLDADTDPANYIFTFKTTSAGTATLIFKDKDGNTLDFGEHTVEAITAEEKTIKIAKSTFEDATKDIYWEVELAGDAIAKMAEITDPTKGIYDIVAPQGIAVDNNTDSKHFGQVYVAAATDGTVSRGAQTRGIFVYNQALEELNSPNAGHLPTNAATAMTDKTRQAIHRVAVNPVNNHVAFAYNVSSSSAVWSMDPENLSGNAINLIDGAGITKANSICFDENGALYVMDNANTGATGGQIYKVENGVATLFAAHQAGYQWAVEDNAMTPDGRGGLWIAQNRWKVDTYPALSHVDKDGKVDFAVTASSSAELQALFPYDDNNASYRGQCAYYIADDILAFAGNKEAVLFKITYDANNVPTNLEKLMSTGKLGTNIDGVAFDYAGDLYVASETTHRMYKFVIPTNDNICTVPAPKSEVIKKEARYTVTVVANDNAMGTATGGGTEFLSGDAVTVTAVANKNYEFVNWTENGTEVSKDAEYTFNIEGDRELVANFQIEPLKIKGIVKRAVQIGESTVVLTHEEDGTPHIYKLVNGALEAEISQVGVVARDPENAGDYLSISDIAATEDGKLVAINKIVCQSEDKKVDAGYKRGETRVYLWDNLDGNPATWFTSKRYSSWFRSVQGHTMAYKGTSTNGTLFTTGVTATGVKFRYSVYNVIDGVYIDPDADIANNEYYNTIKGDAHTTDLVGANYEINVSPLAENTWVFDGNLVDPFEITNPLVYYTEVAVGATVSETLGKKFNGATYFSIAGAHFMVAPYADAEGKVAGVKLMHITDGFAAAKVLKVLDLPNPETATAAATAVLIEEVDNTDGQVSNDVTITLITDAKVHTLTTELDIYVRDIVSGNYGTVCLPNNAIDYCGASLYEVAGKDNGMLYFDEIATMEAGEPYLLLAEQSKLIVVYGTTSVASPDNTGVMKGTFEDIDIVDGTILKGNYMIYNNTLRLCGDGCWLNAYRAYFGKSELDALGKPMAPMPGRRRISMGGAGDNQTTALENITEGSGAITPIIEGTYDVLGRELSEPNATGFYIINGKKVVTIK